jgi:hypothetical protein
MCRCFCQLLEQLNLLDLITHHSRHNARQARAELASKVLQQIQQNMAAAAHSQLPAAAATPDVPAAAVGMADNQFEIFFNHKYFFIYQLEQLLWKIPGAAAIFAALIAHCQQSVDAGNSITANSNNAGSKQGTTDVPWLSSAQEVHSAARSLPLLLRLYFTSDSRAEVRQPMCRFEGASTAQHSTARAHLQRCKQHLATLLRPCCSLMQGLAQGKPEALGNKMLERCLASLADRPVVPGHGDAVVCVLDLLSDCQHLQEVLAARK